MLLLSPIITFLWSLCSKTSLKIYLLEASASSLIVLSRSTTVAKPQSSSFCTEHRLLPEAFFFLAFWTPPSPSFSSWIHHHSHSVSFAGSSLCIWTLHGGGPCNLVLRLFPLFVFSHLLDEFIYRMASNIIFTPVTPKSRFQPRTVLWLLGVPTFNSEAPNSPLWSVWTHNPPSPNNSTLPYVSPLHTNGTINCLFAQSSNLGMRIIVKERLASFKMFLKFVIVKSFQTYRKITKIEQSSHIYPSSSFGQCQFFT